MELLSRFLASVIVIQVLVPSVWRRLWREHIAVHSVLVAAASAVARDLPQYQDLVAKHTGASFFNQGLFSSSENRSSTVSEDSICQSNRVILQYSLGECTPATSTHTEPYALTGQQTTRSAMHVLRDRVSQYMHDKKLKHLEGVENLPLSASHSLAADLPSRFLSALHMEVITNIPKGIAPDEVVRLSNGIPCIEKAYEDSAKFMDDDFLSKRLTSTDEENRGIAAQTILERRDWHENPGTRNAREQVPPNDPYFKKQWNLRGDHPYSINAETAWKVWNGRNRPMIIAVIDSGCDIHHTDLVGNMWKNPGEICGDGLDNDLNGFIDDCHGWDFTRDSPAVAPEKGGHGTSSAGVAAASANNLKATAGVCWGCKIMCLKIFGAEEGLVSNQLQALDYALRNGAWISNNSYGGYGWSELEFEGVRRAQAAGHLFVSSAGNHSVDTDLAKHFHTPSAYPLSNIISVGASTQRGRKAEFSNYGKSSVHVFAPGADIFATGHENGVIKVSGTSFASPHVAGAAGLVWSAFPTLTYAQIKTALVDGCRKVPFLSDKASCGGIVDAYNALRIAARINDGVYTPLQISDSLRHISHIPLNPPMGYIDFASPEDFTAAGRNTARPRHSIAAEAKPSQSALAKGHTLVVGAKQSIMGLGNSQTKIDARLPRGVPLPTSAASSISQEIAAGHARVPEPVPLIAPRATFTSSQISAGDNSRVCMPLHREAAPAGSAASVSCERPAPGKEATYHQSSLLPKIPESIVSGLGEAGLLAESALFLLIQRLIFA